MKYYQEGNFQITRNFINNENISMNLQCSICNEIFNNPMRLDCGHTYCYDCLSDWLKKSGQCPNCRVIIAESLISRDLLAYNITMELDVTCNNESKGCPWKGQLGSLVNHMKSCDVSIEILKENDNKSSLNSLTSGDINKDSIDIQNITPITPIKLKRFISKSVYKLDNVCNMLRQGKNSIELLVKYAREKVIIAPSVLKTEEKKMIKEIFLDKKV